jgi:hypothetical protein
VTESAKIKYSVNLQIQMAGVTILTGVLVMYLKTFKVFLSFTWLQAVNLNVDWQEMMISVPERRIPLLMQKVEELPPTPLYTDLFPEVFSEDGFNSLPPQ